MPNLPQDVIADITVRLPVKSLVCFKCLSNTWRFMIEDPDFVKLHLEHSLNTGSSHYLMLKYNNLYTVDFDSLNAATVMDHRPLYWPDSPTEALCCCNGLVLSRNTEQDLALYNFSTRMYNRLPVEPIAMFQRESWHPRNMEWSPGVGGLEQPEVHLLKALAYSKEGNEVLFLKDGRQVLWYDPKRKRTRRVRIPGAPALFCAELCIGSLVPLRNNGGKEKLELEKKKKKNKEENKREKE